MIRAHAWVLFSAQVGVYVRGNLSMFLFFSPLSEGRTEGRKKEARGEGREEGKENKGQERKTDRHGEKDQGRLLGHYKP